MYRKEFSEILIVSGAIKLAKGRSIAGQDMSK
jgi:hypothetical protein